MNALCAVFGHDWVRFAERWRGWFCGRDGCDARKPWRNVA
jgi:hypothetical protein